MKVKLNPQGLVPAIVQDSKTGEVLMLAYMDEEALQRTQKESEAWFYSRSRDQLWHKGKTSGNYVKVQSIILDCDCDAVLLKAEPTGPVCHTGNPSCFFQALEQEPEFTRESAAPILEELWATIQDRKARRPQGSYVGKLLEEGPDRIAQKVIEEAGEAAIAGAKGDREALVREAADLWFHSLVLLAALDLEPQDVWRELKGRRK